MIREFVFNHFHISRIILNLKNTPPNKTLINRNSHLDYYIRVSKSSKSITNQNEVVVVHLGNRGLYPALLRQTSLLWML